MHLFEIRPMQFEQRLNGFEIGLRVLEMRPRVFEIGSRELEMRPNGFEIRLHGLEIGLHELEMDLNVFEMRPNELEQRPHGLEIGSRELEMRPQRLKRHSGGFEIDPQGSKGRWREGENGLKGWKMSLRGSMERRIIAWRLTRRRIPFVGWRDALVMPPLARPGIVRPACAGFRQTSITPEEASANLGASPLRTLRKITLPLVMANLIAGTILTLSFAMLAVSDGLILAMKEEYYPITKMIYQLMGRLDPNAPSVACALGVVGMALLTASLLLAGKLLGKKMGQLFRA